MDGPSRSSKVKPEPIDKNLIKDEEYNMWVQ